MKKLLLILALLIPAPVWAAYANVYTITINHTLVPSDQSPYVLTFHSTLTALKTQANGGDLLNASGYDYRFTSQSTSCNTSKLYWEEVKHDLVSGELEAHIHLPSGVSASSDTLLYLCTANASVVASEAECITGLGLCTHTWTDNSAGYVTVHHFPNGSSLSVADSVASATQTNHGLTATTGAIDGVAAGLQASNQYTDTGDPFSNNSVTMEAWVKSTGVSSLNIILSNITTGTTNGYRMFQHTASGGLLFCDIANAGTVNERTVALPNSGIWFYALCSVTSGGALFEYLRPTNSTSETQTNAGVASGTSVQNLLIGGDPRGDVGDINTSIDEVRVSTVARDQNYADTVFNNTCWAGAGGTACSTAFYTISGSSPLAQGQPLIHSTIY